MSNRNPNPKCWECKETCPVQRVGYHFVDGKRICDCSCPWCNELSLP